MTALSPALKIAASSPSQPPRSEPVLRELLINADQAFKAKLQGEMSYVCSNAMEKRKQAWQKSGFPDLHRDRAKNLFQTQSPWANELLRLARHYLAVVDEPNVAARVDSGVLVGLVGGRGGGKTQLAACLGRIEVAWGRHPKYTSAQTLFRKLRSSYDNKGQNEQALIDSLIKPSLLVIDELHDRAETHFETRILNTIIDGRYNRGKRTMLISNETADQFAQSIGPSIASRFEETGEIITVEWPSFRNN